MKCPYMIISLDGAHNLLSQENNLLVTEQNPIATFFFFYSYDEEINIDLLFLSSVSFSLFIISMKKKQLTLRDSYWFDINKSRFILFF